LVWWIFLNDLRAPSIHPRQQRRRENNKKSKPYRTPHTKNETAMMTLPIFPQFRKCLFKDLLLLLLALSSLMCETAAANQDIFPPLLAFKLPCVGAAKKKSAHFHF
jgi:hypothetical protein